MGRASPVRSPRMATSAKRTEVAQRSSVLASAAPRARRARASTAPAEATELAAPTQADPSDPAAPASPTGPTRAGPSDLTGPVAPVGPGPTPGVPSDLVPEDPPDAELRRSDVDEWGRSESFRAAVRRAYAPLYERWFRVEWEGFEKIPAHGGALLVSNHAGAVPADAPSIMHGIETRLGRPVYGLADEMFRRLPVAGTLWARAGGVLAHPDNAVRLLRDQQQLALVFPEGTKATTKPYAQRYELRRFGRGGFVEIAMRAGVPVVPLAVVGAEEASPLVWNNRPLARLLGVPYFPLTANLLAFAPLGPLGAFLWFPAKIRIRVLDPVTFDVPPGQHRYSRSRVLEESERIRHDIQQALYDMLRRRRSVWSG